MEDLEEKPGGSGDTNMASDRPSSVEFSTLPSRKIKKANRVLLPQWKDPQTSFRRSFAEFEAELESSDRVESIDRPIRPRKSAPHSPEKIRLYNRQLVRKVASIPSIVPTIKIRRPAPRNSNEPNKAEKENAASAEARNFSLSQPLPSATSYSHGDKARLRTPEPADSIRPQESSSSSGPAQKKQRSSLSNSLHSRAKTPDPQTLPTLPSPPKLPSPPSYLPRRSSAEIREYIHSQHQRRHRQQIETKNSKKSSSQKIKQSLKSLDGFRRYQRDLVQKRKEMERKRQQAIVEQASSQLEGEPGASPSKTTAIIAPLRANGSQEIERNLPGEESIDRLIDEAHSLFNSYPFGSQTNIPSLPDPRVIIEEDNNTSDHSLSDIGGGVERIEQILDAAQKLRDRVNKMAGLPKEQLQSLIGFLDTMSGQVQEAALLKTSLPQKRQSLPNSIDSVPTTAMRNVPTDLDELLAQTTALSAEMREMSKPPESPFLPSDSDISAAAPRNQQQRQPLSGSASNPGTSVDEPMVLSDVAPRIDMPKFEIPGDQMSVMNVLERRWNEINAKPLKSEQRPYFIPPAEPSDQPLSKQQIFEHHYNSNLAFSSESTPSGLPVEELMVVQPFNQPPINPITVTLSRFDNEPESSSAPTEDAESQNIESHKLHRKLSEIEAEDEGKVSPRALGKTLANALDVFDSIQESRIRLEDLENSRQLMIAQQETFALAKILEERQRKFDHDLNSAKQKKQATIVSDGFVAAKPSAIPSMTKNQSLPIPQLDAMDISLNELFDLKPEEFSVKAIEEMLAKEKSRTKEHELLLNLREKTMEEQVRSEIAYLRQQRYGGKDGIAGAFDTEGNLNRDLERAIMMRFAAEKAEIQRLKRLNREKSVQRQKKLIKAQIEAVTQRPTIIPPASAPSTPINQEPPVGGSYSVPEEINEQLQTFERSIPEEIDRSSNKYTSVPESIAESANLSEIQQYLSAQDQSITTVNTTDDSMDDESLKELMGKLDDLRAKNEIQRLQQRQKKLDITKSMARELLGKRQKKLEWEKKMKAEVEKINRILDKALATDASLSSISMLSDDRNLSNSADNYGSSNRQRLPDVKQVLEKGEVAAVEEEEDAQETSVSEISEGIPSIEGHQKSSGQSSDIKEEISIVTGSSIREELDVASQRTRESSVSELTDLPIALKKSLSNLSINSKKQSSEPSEQSQLEATYAELNGSAADMINRINELQKSVENARLRAAEIADEKSTKQELLKEKLKSRELALRQELEKLQNESFEQQEREYVTNQKSVTDTAVNSILEEINNLSAEAEVMKVTIGSGLPQTETLDLGEMHQFGEIASNITAESMKDSSEASESVGESIHEKIEIDEAAAVQNFTKYAEEQFSHDSTNVQMIHQEPISVVNAQAGALHEIISENETIMLSNEMVGEILQMENPAEEPPAAPVMMAQPSLEPTIDLNQLTDELTGFYLNQVLDQEFSAIANQLAELFRPPSPEKEKEDSLFVVEEGVPVFEVGAVQRALDILLRSIPDDRKFSSPPFLTDESLDMLMQQPYIGQHQRIGYRALFDAVNEAMLDAFPDYENQKNPAYWLKDKRSLSSRALGTVELRAKVSDRLLKWMSYGLPETGNLDKMLADEIREDERKWLDVDFDKIEAEEVITAQIWEELIGMELGRLA